MGEHDNEQEAVRTTIVGGRPPGSGRSNVTVPRGIEVLVKKAAVDSEFRDRLLDQRGGAAADIGLELDPAENAMLSVIPSEQLAQIIGQTTVPLEQRRVFLGRIAAAMLAVLGAGLSGCEPAVQSAGVRPAPPSPTNVPPPAPAGVRPDPPSADSPPTNAPFVRTPEQDAAFRSRGIQPDRP